MKKKKKKEKAPNTTHFKKPNARPKKAKVKSNAITSYFSKQEGTTENSSNGASGNNSKKTIPRILSEEFSAQLSRRPLAPLNTRNVQ